MRNFRITPDVLARRTIALMVFVATTIIEAIRAPCANTSDSVILAAVLAILAAIALGGWQTALEYLSVEVSNRAARRAQQEVQNG